MNEREYRKHLNNPQAKTPAQAESNIDQHPLRYVPLRDDIEKILFRRALEKRLQGYTLETSLEIAEMLTTRYKTPAARPLHRRDSCEFLEPGEMSKGFARRAKDPWG